MFLPGFLAALDGGPGMKRDQSIPGLADLSLTNEPIKTKMLIYFERLWINLTLLKRY